MLSIKREDDTEMDLFLKRKKEIICACFTKYNLPPYQLIYQQIGQKVALTYHYSSPSRASSKSFSKAEACWWCWDWSAAFVFRASVIVKQIAVKYTKNPSTYFVVIRVFRQYIKLTLCASMSFQQNSCSILSGNLWFVSQMRYRSAIGLCHHYQLRG